MTDLTVRTPAKVSVIDKVLTGHQHAARINTRCVIFVHGITGHPLTTWRASPSSPSFIELLLRDVEEQDLDVFTFGYRTTYFRGAPINNAAIQLAAAIEELMHKRRYEVVLIAHSMGGLVCMRYILDQLARRDLRRRTTSAGK